MATLKKKRKLAAVTRETQEKHPVSAQSRNTSVLRISEDDQFSEEIGGRVTKQLSQEFSRTKARILGALSKLDEFLLSPQIRTHPGTVPGTSRKTNVEKQEPNGDRSQNDPHTEVESSVYSSHISIYSDPGGVSHNYNFIHLIANNCNYYFISLTDKKIFICFYLLHYLKQFPLFHLM